MKKKHILSVLSGILLLGICACDKGRMWETPGVRPHEEKLIVMPKGTVPFDGGEEIYITTPAKDLHSPLNRQDPSTVQQGKDLYFTYCAQCHGRQFDGNGTVGQSFAPLPADLKSEKVQSLAEGEMFKSISYGVTNGRQPPLATTIEAAGRWRIIAFVQSLGK